VEPTLPAHLRVYARNFQLLQKSKEEMSIDMALRANDTGEIDDLDSLNIIDPIEDIDLSASEDIAINPDLHLETLVMTYHNIVSLWHKNGIATARRYAGLNVNWTASHDLQDRKLNVSQLMSSGSSNLRFVPNDILEDWRSDLKRRRETNNITNSIDTFNDFMEPDSSQANDGQLIPTLLLDEEIDQLRNSPVLLEDNPSASAVMDLVCEKFSLNQKQRLVVEKIIAEALSWKDNPYDASKRDQLLLHVGGEAGTGESQIVKAIMIALSLLRREAEIVLMAPTGSAADNIDGNTYHTTLGMSIGNKTNHAPARRIQHL
jgi:hypothetical protein